MKSWLMFGNLIFFVGCIAVAALVDVTAADKVTSLIAAAANALAFELNRRTD